MGMSTRLFWSLVGGEDRRKLWEVITKEEFDDAEARAERDRSRAWTRRRWIAPTRTLIARRDPQRRRDAAARLPRTAAGGLGRSSETPRRDLLTAWLRDIIAEHRRLWLARNRPGGLGRQLQPAREARLADYVR